MNSIKLLTIFFVCELVILRFQRVFSNIATKTCIVRIITMKELSFWDIQVTTLTKVNFCLYYRLLTNAANLTELGLAGCNCDGLDDLLCKMSSLRKLRLVSCNLKNLPPRYLILQFELQPSALHKVSSLLFNCNGVVYKQENWREIQH